MRKLIFVSICVLVIIAGHLVACTTPTAMPTEAPPTPTAMATEAPTTPTAMMPTEAPTETPTRGGLTEMTGGAMTSAAVWSPVWSPNGEYYAVVLQPPPYGGGAEAWIEIVSTDGRWATLGYDGRGSIPHGGWTADSRFFVLRHVAHYGSTGTTVFDTARWITTNLFPSGCLARMDWTCTYGVVAIDSTMPRILLQNGLLIYLPTMVGHANVLAGTDTKLVGLAAWSPDDQYLAFVTFPDMFSQGDLLSLFLARSDGEQVQQIASINDPCRENCLLTWTPNGQSVVFHTELNLYEFGLDEVQAMPVPESTLPSQEIVEREAADAVPALIEALRDEDESVRQAAAKALWSIGPEEGVVPALIEDEHVRWAAAEALGRIGPEEGVVPALIEALEDEDIYVSHAIQALGRIGPEAADAVPALIEVLGDENEYVRQAAAEALGRIGPEEGVVPALIEALGDQDAGVRTKAAEALGSIGPEEDVVSALIEALEDTDEYMQAGAAKVLGFFRLSDGGAVPALIEALEDQDAGVRTRAAWALGRIGPEAADAVPALIEALEVDEGPDYWGESYYASWALAEIGSEAIPALIEALRGEDESVRQAAASALGRIGPEAASSVPTLIEALEDQDESVRWNAVEALEKITGQRP